MELGDRLSQVSVPVTNPKTLDGVLVGCLGRLTQESFLLHRMNLNSNDENKIIRLHQQIEKEEK